MPAALFGALLVVRLFDEAGSFLPYGAAPQLRTQLDLSYAQIGVLLTAMPAGGVVGLGLAALADVVSRRRLAAISTAVLALTMAAFAMSDEFLVLAAAAFVYGAASDGMISPVEVALADLAGDDLDRALARTNLFATIGDFLAPVLLGAAIVAGLGVRPVFWIAALAFAGYAVWLASLPLPAPRDPGREHVRGRVVSLIRDPRVWAMGVLVACISPLDEALGAAFVLRLAARRGGGPAGRARRGRRCDRRSGRARRSPRASSAGSGGPARWPSACCSWARRSRSQPSARPSRRSSRRALTGFGLAFAWTAFQGVLLRLRPGAEGTTGAVIGAIELPALLLPVLAGVVADHAGPQAALAVYAAISLTGAGSRSPCTRLLDADAETTCPSSTCELASRGASSSPPRRAGDRRAEDVAASASGFTSTL